MNYKDKNNMNIEHDDLNIKSHLNASLDLSGISVSEDLINRTLEAIRKQSAEQADNKDDSGLMKETQKDTKKVIPWNRYIRGFASVAAAALIIVAGYGLLNNIGLSKKSSENSTADRSIYDTAATLAPQEFAANSAADAAPSDNGATAKSSDGGTLGTTSAQGKDETVNISPAALSEAQYTVTADTTLAAEGEGSTGSVGIAAAGEADQSDSSIMSTESAPVLTFRDIFLPDPAQAQSLTVTDDINGTAITLTDQNAILDFYSMMDKYQFTYSTQADTQKNYSAVITAPQEASYTMVIGSNITVSYMDSKVASQSIYTVSDNALLLTELNDFINMHKQ